MTPTNPSPRTSSIVGVAWALLAIFGWGLMFPVGRVLMASRALSPESVAAARYLLAAPLLFALSFLRAGRRTFPPRLRDWPLLAFWGLVGSALMAWLLFCAQRTVPVVNASLLEAWVPLLVMLIGLPLGDSFSLRRLAAIAIGFLGVLLVLRILAPSGFRLDALRGGDLLILLSGLCWSLYTVFGGPLVRRLGALPFTAWTVLFGGLWIVAASLLFRRPLALPPDATSWFFVGVLALCPTALSFFAWNEAQRHLPLPRLAFLEYFTPVVAALLGLLWPGEPVSPAQWLGMLLILLSSFF